MNGRPHWKLLCLKHLVVSMLMVSSRMIRSNQMMGLQRRVCFSDLVFFRYHLFHCTSSSRVYAFLFIFALFA